MSSFNDAMESATSFVLDASLRTTFVLLTTILIGWSLRSAAASARRLVWIGGLTTSLMIPLMMAVGPAFPIVILAEESPPPEIATVDRLEFVVPQAVPDPTIESTVNDTAAAPDSDENSLAGTDNTITQPVDTGPSELTLAARNRRTQQANSTAVWTPNWSVLTLAIFLAGVAVQLARLIVGNARVRNLVRTSTDDTPQEWSTDWFEAKATMQVGDGVLLRESPTDISPLACGVLHRTVLFPIAAREWERDRRRAVMLHELGHVRQRDVAAILLGQLAAAVYFFHPLVWFVVRQLRHDCERACDDLVLNAGQQPVAYARHLAEIARSFSTSRHKTALAMAMSRSSNIESRVTAILDPDLPRQPLSSWSRRSILAAALLASVLVAAPQASHSQTASADTSPAILQLSNQAASTQPSAAADSSVRKIPKRAPRQRLPRTDRNNVFAAPTAPESWDVKTGKNVLWSAKLGSQTYGSPVVSGGRVFVGTNNAGGYVDRLPSTTDLGCLLAFDATSGKFLWQYSAEKLPTGRVNDWPRRGIPSSPYVNGDRLWIVNNRSEVVCLDTSGFYDDQDDGPIKDAMTTGEQLIKNEADMVWSLDLIKTFGSFPHHHSNCTITSDGKLLFIVVPNGRDESHRKLPSPRAPSFIAVNAKTGAVVWTNLEHSDQILHGQWASAAYGQLGGVSQVICPSGSGWLFGLDAATGKTLWKFDCNPKDAKWILGGRGRRNNLVAPPLIYDRRVYIGTGQDIEHGEGKADLWCIDPTKRGDVSPTIADQSQFVPNPNSALIWNFDKADNVAGQKLEFEDVFHRSLSTPVAKDGLLITADSSGLVHCFDAKTGQRHWTHDLFAVCTCSPIIINDRVYIGDEDGEVAIFKLSKQKELVAEISMNERIYATPTAADGVLYQSTYSRLFAIKPGSTAEIVAVTKKPEPTLQALRQQMNQLTAALAFTKQRGTELEAQRDKLQQMQKTLQVKLEIMQKAAEKKSQP
ncbi:MAG: outer membrane protein assembly factor BamB family protein [Planctomycetales bacterium]